MAHHHHHFRFWMNLNTVLHLAHQEKLSFLGYLSELLEGMPLQVLMKWHALGQLLEDLIPRWECLITVHVKNAFGLETGRRDNFNTSVVICLFHVVELLDVVHGRLKLFLCRSEDWHLVYVTEGQIDILRLNQRVLDGLVKQFFLFLLRHSIVVFS